jgi:DNA-binding XRE family transcriptional regulator
MGVALLINGNQLKAARALAGIDQGELAERAGLNVSTIGAIEKRRGQVIASGLPTVKAITDAFRPFGVEFIHTSDYFGVRIKSSDAA